MIFNDSRNVTSGSSSMLYSSDIVSVVYVDSCVFFGFTLLGNCDRASASLILSPRIY